MSSISIQPAHLANTCLVLSSFITLSNVFFLANPAVSLEQLGFKAKLSSETSTDSNASTNKDANADAVPLALCQMNSATRIALGLSSVAMWWYRDYRALGWATMAGCIMSGVDGWVATRLGVGSDKVGVHWGSAPVAILLGGGLLAKVGI